MQGGPFVRCADGCYVRHSNQIGLRTDSALRGMNAKVNIFVLCVALCGAALLADYGYYGYDGYDEPDPFDLMDSTLELPNEPPDEGHPVVPEQNVETEKPDAAKPGPHVKDDAVRAPIQEGFKEITLDKEDEALVRDVIDILHGMQDARTTPEALSPSFRTEFLRNLVKRLNPKADLVAAPTSEEKTVEPAECHSYPAKIIASQRVFYARLDNLDRASFEKLAEDSTAAARLADKPLGIVLDLRNCASGDEESLLNILGVLVEPEKLPKPCAPRESVVLHLPLITLVGPGTKGFGELLAEYLSAAGEALVIGSPTTGTPPSIREVKLFTNDRLVIPVYPEWVDGTFQKSVAPDITAPPAPIVDFEKLSTSVGAEKDDPSLTKAVDLLSCLDTIRNKRNYFDEHSPDE